MQVELAHELILDSQLRIVRTEQESVRENNCRTALLLKPVHDDGHEKIGCLGTGKVSWEVSLHVSLF